MMMDIKNYQWMTTEKIESFDFILLIIYNLYIIDISVYSIPLI